MACREEEMPGCIVAAGGSTHRALSARIGGALGPTPSWRSLWLPLLGGTPRGGRLSHTSKGVRVATRAAYLIARGAALRRGGDSSWWLSHTPEGMRVAQGAATYSRRRCWAGPYPKHTCGIPPSRHCRVEFDCSQRKPGEAVTHLVVSQIILT